MADVSLRGCRPEPLSDYLKGLALLRLVAQQEDVEARGWWEDGRFILSSCLDEDGLVEFLADRYRPTPLVAPWNGGSGFHPGDNRKGMNAIIEDTSQRLAEYRMVINKVTELPAMPREPRFVGEILYFLRGLVQTEGDSREQGGVPALVETLNRCKPNAARVVRADLDEVPLVSLQSAMRGSQADPLATEWYKAFKKGMTHFSRMQRSADKELLLSSCRSHLPDSVLPWLDATFALTEFDGPAYGAVLGSGGNEGRLDYTNNFMQHIALLLLGDRDFSVSCLRAALFSTMIDSLPRSSIGQFQPGRAGGFNQGPGVEHKDVPINPWDFVLSMEGAVVLASSVARRQGSTRTAATSPFTVSIARVGYQSSNAEDSGRAESWLPLWGRPARYAEIAGLLREGRATVGRRSAGNGIDMARAVATFGVDRGITSFVRYGFLKRRGDSFVALPMGRVQVRSLPTVTLLNDVDRILFQVSALARGRNAPARLLAAHRKLEEALFNASLRGTPDSFQAVVVALGHVVRWMGHVAGSESGRGRLSRPLPASLSLDWIKAMDDGSVEYRLALALASIKGGDGGVGPIASNLLPLDPVRTSRWATGAGQEAWKGRSLPARMAATLVRRLNDAGVAADGGVRLASVIEATPLDVAEFLVGRTDDGRIEDLVWGLTLVRWSMASRVSMQRSNAPEQPLSRAWCLLKLLFLPPNRLGTTVRPEPRIVPMLASGDRGLALKAIELAHTRLLVDGLRPRRFDPHVDFDPERMAGALLVPTGGVLRWRGRVLKPDELES